MALDEESQNMTAFVTPMGQVEETSHGFRVSARNFPKFNEADQGGTLL